MEPEQSPMVALARAFAREHPYLTCEPARFVEMALLGGVPGGNDCVDFLPLSRGDGRCVQCGHRSYSSIHGNACDARRDRFDDWGRFVKAIRELVPAAVAECFQTTRGENGQ